MDLTKLAILPINKDIEVEIPRELFSKTSILDIPKFVIHLEIKRNHNQDEYLIIQGNGHLVLEDAITLDPVNYPFSLDIEELISPENENVGQFLINSQNTLDIIAILWENIVLEIPISYSVHSFEKQEKDGWQLIGENEEKIDPRLAPLMELLDKEKE